MLFYPLVYAHTRLANDVKVGEGTGSRQFNGLVDVYRKTLKTDGLAGLYCGFVTACIGIVVYRGCYFGFYDTLKPILLSENAGMLRSVALGYVATISAGLIAYPLDTICRRMMMRSGQAVKYRGVWDCPNQIIKNEGHISFMKGVGAVILSGMFSAGLLAGYDRLKKLYIY